MRLLTTAFRKNAKQNVTDLPKDAGSQRCWFTSPRIWGNEPPGHAQTLAQGVKADADVMIVGLITCQAWELVQRNRFCVKTSAQKAEPIF